MICNDLRLEVLTLQICREAKRTLPRPKVGDFCTLAMEQGFADACVPLCTDTRPVSRVAQVCRAAAIEMPRPTVRKWCEHGYNMAFEKTLTDLRDHFRAQFSETAVVEDVKQEASEVVADDISDVSESDALIKETVEDTVVHAIEEETRELLTTIPVTLDEKALDLKLYKGQNPEDAVVEFCRHYVDDDVAGCIRQLLPVVLERMEETA